MMSVNSFSKVQKKSVRMYVSVCDEARKTLWHEMMDIRVFTVLLFQIFCIFGKQTKIKM